MVAHFWLLMLFYSDLLLLMEPFIAVVPCKAGYQRQSVEFGANLMQHESVPRHKGLPDLETFTAWQTLTPAERVTPSCAVQTGHPASAGYPTYHVIMINSKCEILSMGGFRFPTSM